jgi:hypothetical protein
MEQDDLKRSPQSVPADGSFLYNRCSEEELNDYDAGFKAGSKRLEMDGARSPAWRSGWSEAQEFGLHFRWSA